MADAAPKRANPARVEADRSNWTLWVGIALMLVGFLFQTEIKYDEDPIKTAYSVSLGVTCETDLKACRVRANLPIAFRPETTRNEVTEFDFARGKPGALRLYTGCVIWSAGDWSCEGGRIAMSNGVIAHDELQADPDIYFVPKIAWKMAKLHILPVDSVRHAKIEPPKPKQGA